MYYSVPSYIRTKAVREQTQRLQYKDWAMPNYWYVHKPTFDGKIHSLTPAYNVATNAVVQNIELVNARKKIAKAEAKNQINKKLITKLDDLFMTACAYDEDVALCCHGIYLDINGITDYTINCQDEQLAENVLDKYLFTADVMLLYAYANKNPRVHSVTQQNIKNMLDTVMNLPIDNSPNRPLLKNLISEKRAGISTTQNPKLRTHIHLINTAIVEQEQQPSAKPDDYGFADEVTRLYHNNINSDTSQVAKSNKM